jgi:hypothetical protein
MSAPEATCSVIAWYPPADAGGSVPAPTASMLVLFVLPVPFANDAVYRLRPEVT